MTDSPRIIELRRRIQVDPASIAFAQLAEECRRAGANDEAVSVCRAGLAHHPNYLSARVTLGRALLELGQLDDALVELSGVVKAAPDNLPAIRGIAEIHHRRGNMPDALIHYRRALQLARHDVDLEHAVERIAQVVHPPESQPTTQASAAAIEELFDFENLLKQLGNPEGPPPPPVVDADRIPEGIAGVALPPPTDDPLATIESGLRALEGKAVETAPETPGPAPQAAETLQSLSPLEYREALLDEFEQWLDAIVSDRERSNG